MEVRRYEDPATWLADATPLLLADEPRHNLMFGIVDRLIHRPDSYPEHRLWVATDAGHPVGAIMQTPPYPVIVARPATDDALDTLVEAALPLADTIPGVNGARPEVERFVDVWTSRTGTVARVSVSMGVYGCRRADDVPGSPGTPRLGMPDDMDRVFPLMLAFADEALTADAVRDRERERATTLDRLSSPPEVGGVWLWEDDDAIVSISGHGGRTPNGIRIGPVYTPPAHRGRGYATSLVRAQTAWLLANAVDVCFLYTDLANPTSNAIYRRIGYEQVAEAAEFRFDAQVQSGGSGA